MASPQRRFMVQKPVLVDVGCGCRRSIFSTLFSSPSSSSSSLKQRIPKTLSFSSLSSTTSSPAATASPFSSSSSPAKQETSDRKGGKQSRAVKRRKRTKRNGVVEESVAVVKESLNPYLDFYESILVMIVEKEMYGWEDLCQLLHQYISLNSSGHHDIILRAFADIWKNVFLPAAEVAGG
ncbi:transcription repressor OFP8-like [Phalaenopsis equestris]|uniref:transcription repressor OFP8-like n=1 Tax=Phalaenopsis equestris TaxID=78828 RepID=UPI0009E45599|nr:transcription repressor OFP8-like [Phalaenopsis equestris]